MARLDGAWWKFQRAYDQTGQLSSALRVYLEADPFRVTHEQDDESGDHVLQFGLTERPKPIWAVQLGEIVHDLHSALDHAIWQLVLDNGNRPQEGITGFPIFTDETNYLLGRNRRRPGIAMVNGVPDSARTLITNIQPYQIAKSGQKPEHMALAVLHELWNIDKHRLLHLLTLGAIASGLSLISKTLDVSLTNVRIGSPILKDGAEIARFGLVGPAYSLANVQVHVDITPQITLDESMPEWVRQDGVMNVIAKIGNEVRDILRALSSYAIDRPAL